MDRFNWKGRNVRGELITGTLNAGSEAAVADQLLAGGVTPVTIAPNADLVALARPSWWQALRGQPITSEDTLVLARQLHSLLRAGVPLLRALAGLQASSIKPALSLMLADVRASLDQGRELSAAMARHPRAFSGFFVAMTRVGEMTGRLPEVFQRLAEHIEFETDIRARIGQALRYPAMVMVAMGIALVVINLFVLPTFASVFAGFKTQLPLMTRVLLGFSAFTLAWWPALLVAGSGGFVALRSWLATPDGRYRWDRLKLRLPIVGTIVLKATLARFARSFALASRSGIPLSQAMTVVAQTVDNAWIASRIEQMRDGVERGGTLSRCAAASGIFTPVVLQMIAVGEETGELDTLLVEVAGMYERETAYGIKNLAGAIEPLLLLVIAGLVLVLALGVFLPLWNLGQAALGKPG
ncbi:type II secretion system F family protein [Rhizobacter sp. SG703]|uniref:type II secretion system F family protein n=1 Tax=Rhizobacter sp. SG703 TaxID=2587140 RepID=UPI001444CB84|nr:type II secretion system F family protein [Rhizobacter sp. SG703]NKI92756.1 MSHA biogenesis protein MshG [Rhizobacter sp. SG703]